MTVSTDANLAVAGGTIILAFFTWRAAEASRSAAEATGRAAEAAQIEAEATVQLAQEAREDRELAWRPHLGVLMGQPSAAPDFDSIDVTVTNVGNGPALDCRVWLYATNRWTWRDVEPLATQQQLPLPEPIWVPHFGGLPPFPQGMFDPPPGGRPHHGSWVLVATCTDVLGNRWRFMNGQQPERIHSNDPHPPPWLQWLGVQPHPVSDPTRP